MPTPEKRLRLMQLASNSLPVGGYSWSRGLEWAVEAGWVEDSAAFEHWQQLQMEQSFLPSTCHCLPGYTGPVKRAILTVPGAGPLICWPAGKPVSYAMKNVTAVQPSPDFWSTGSPTARPNGANYASKAS